jgi:Subtilase family
MTLAISKVAAQSAADGGVGHSPIAGEASLLARTPTSTRSVGGKAVLDTPLFIGTVYGAAPNSRYGLQGRVMTSHTTGGGRIFWLEGKDSNYLLRDPAGKAIGNQAEALSRARQLITAGGATKLHRIDNTATQTEMRAPDTRVLRVNLESPQINSKGGTAHRFLNPLLHRGQPGSALAASTEQAIGIANELGLKTVVTAMNPKASAAQAQMAAFVELSNDFAGGQNYARITQTVGRPEVDFQAAVFALPANASAAFREGYWSRRQKLEGVRFVQAAKDIGETAVTGKTNSARAKGTTAARAGLAPAANGNSGLPRPAPSPSATPPANTRAANAADTAVLRPASAASPTSASRPSKSSGAPLPPQVAKTAAQFKAPPNAAREVMESLGGNFDATDAVHHLRSKHGMSAEAASGLVKAVRQVQAQSTRTVVDTINQASARTAADGSPRPAFTAKDWESIAPALAQQPKVDNAGAGALVRLLADGRFRHEGRSTIEPLTSIKQYLASVGYARSTLRLKAVVKPGQAYAANPTATDRHFAPLAAKVGIGANARLKVAVLDVFDFSKPVSAANRLNTNVGKPKPTDALTDAIVKPEHRTHGNSVASIASAGAGRWIQVDRVRAVLSSEIVNVIDASVAAGAKVVNVSMGFGDLSRAMAIRDAVDRHPGVLFVVSGGNGRYTEATGDVAAHSRDSALSNRLLGDRRNVMYAGAVNRQGQITGFATYGTPGPHLYALGQDSPAAGRTSPDQRYTKFGGSSASAPAVSNALAKVMLLAPKIQPSTARQIVMQTARSVPQDRAAEWTRTSDGQAVRPDVKPDVPRSVPVLDSNAASNVAALVGLLQKQAAAPSANATTQLTALNQAADRLGLTGSARSRAIKVAQTALAADARAASPSPTPVAASTRPAKASSTRTGDAITDRYFSGAVARVTNPAESTFVQSTGARRLNALLGGLDGIQIDASDRLNESVTLNAVARTGNRSMTVQVDPPGTRTPRVLVMDDGGLWRTHDNPAKPGESTLPRAVAVAARQAKASGLQTYTVTLNVGGAQRARLVEMGFNRIKIPVSATTEPPPSFKMLFRGVGQLDVTLLAATSAGKQWLNEQNGNLQLSFDLRTGSNSWEALERYLKQHQIKLPPP